MSAEKLSPGAAARAARDADFVKRFGNGGQPKSVVPKAAPLAEAAPYAAQEASKYEARFLKNLTNARDDFEWIKANEAWKTLGHESFTSWWETRVAPIMSALSMRPSRAVASEVVDRALADDAAVPEDERRGTGKIAQLAGVDRKTVQRRTGAAMSHPETSAAVTADPTEDASPALGEPDVDVEATSTSGTQSSGSESVGTRLGSGGGEPIADGLDSSPTGAATAPVPVGAAQERIEEITCPLCDFTVDVWAVDPDPSLDEMLSHLRDPHGLTPDEALNQLARVRTISPAADTSDTESQVVLQQPGPDSPTGREGGRSETDFPVGPDHPVATTVLPGIDHHMSAGVSDSGVAPGVPHASVEPVELEDGGEPARRLPSSSDLTWLPDSWSGANGDDVLYLFNLIEEAMDRVEPDVVGPVLTVGEIASLHKTADRVAQIASLIEHWRTP